MKYLKLILFVLLKRILNYSPTKLARKEAINQGYRKYPELSCFCTKKHLIISKLTTNLVKKNQDSIFWN